MKLYLVAALGLFACTSSPGSNAGLAGKWVGTSAEQQHYELTIADHDGALTGAGFVDPGNLSGGAVSVAVTGAVAGMDVSLRFDTGGHADAFTGVVVDADHITGVIESEPDIALSLERIGPPGNDPPPPPPPADPWQAAEDRLVDARCNSECSQPTADCESATHADMAQARAELADADEPQCIACMNALSSGFESATRPDCMPTTTEDVFTICEAEIDGTTVILHACNGHPVFPTE